MKALLYLARTKLKNQLKSLLKKPARLIYALVLLALLCFTLWSGSQAGRYSSLRPMAELEAIAMALYGLMFLMTVDTGFSRGGQLFNLSDVNLLFTAPLRPQTVLFYGLFQQMTMSLLVGFFLLFQYTWLHMNYGVTLGQLLGLLLGYALTVFLAQVTAMVLYSFTSADEGRQRLCRGALYGVTACVLLYVLAQALPGGREGLLERAVAAVGSPVVRAYPVAGWLSLAVSGLLTGQSAWALLGLGLCAVYLAALVLVVFRKNPDYYEDVLRSAEVSQSAINAKREGTMTEAAPLKVKVGRRGLGRGWGASAFFWKHRLENRRSRKLLLSGNALTFAVIAVVFAFFFREGGLLPVFAMTTYLQIFTVLLGRINLELRKPYLYLIPEPPMKKLLWVLAEALPSAALETLVVYVPVSLVLGLDLPAFLACAFARLSYAVLFTASNVVVERLWGGVASRVLVMLLFLAVALVLALPGVVLAFVAALAWGLGAAGGLLVLAVCNLPIALLALFLCRNMLQYAELNQQ